MLIAHRIYQPKGGVPMRQGKKEIKAVLHLPKSEYAIRQFEERIADFYVKQVEQRIRFLPKEQKLTVLDILLASHNKPKH